MRNQPEANVNSDGKAVSLPGGQFYDLPSWERAPKIAETHQAEHESHLAGGAPLAQKSREAETNQNCLTCHNPHASQADHLLRPAARFGGVTYFRRPRWPILMANARAQSVRPAQEPASGRQA
jgi:hypothetical protein